jgi:hypothetical protein
MKQANVDPEETEYLETGEPIEEGEREYLEVDDDTYSYLINKQLAITRGDNRRTEPMGEEERKLREQKCYCCGGDGHIRPDCPLDKILKAKGIGQRSVPRFPKQPYGSNQRPRQWNPRNLTTGPAPSTGAVPSPTNPSPSSPIQTPNQTSASPPSNA